MVLGEFMPIVLLIIVRETFIVRKGQMSKILKRRFYFGEDS